MIDYKEINGLPDEKTFEEIKQFYASIFETVDFQKVEKRFSEATDLLINLALDNEKIIGFKIGYKIAPKKFYSWVGGVDKNYRKHGIAQELMKRQHDWCRKNGFDVVQTKTKNSFKAMLILNLKSGFDIIDVYKDINNELKIVLEKDLAKS